MLSSDGTLNPSAPRAIAAAALSRISIGSVRRQGTTPRLGTGNFLTKGPGRGFASPCLDSYGTLNKGPWSSGNVAVLRTWMPASWLLVNVVAVPGQPAATASSGVLNQIPR